MRFCVCVTAMFGSLAATGALIAGQASPVPSIETPSHGQTVEKKELVTIRTAGDGGAPIVASKPEGEEARPFWAIADGLIETLAQTK